MHFPRTRPRRSGRLLFVRPPSYPVGLQRGSSEPSLFILNPVQSAADTPRRKADTPASPPHRPRRSAPVPPGEWGDGAAAATDDVPSLSFSPVVLAALLRHCRIGAGQGEQQQQGQ